MMTFTHLNDHSGYCAEDGLEEEEWRSQETSEEVGAIVQVKDDDGTLDGNGGSGTVDLDRLQLFRR